MPAVPLSQVAVHLRPADNVAVAARTLPPGLEVEFAGRVLTLQGRVGMGHKLAVRAIAAGEAVTKYGQIIGFAGTDIPAGTHVHVHNVRADAFERDYAIGRDCPPPMTPVADAPGSPPIRYFDGYDRGADRPDHLRYGTRNY